MISDVTPDLRQMIQSLRAGNLENAKDRIVALIKKAELPTSGLKLPIEKVASAMLFTLNAFAVVAFSTAMTRLAGHWSVALAPLIATAQTVPSRATTLAHS